MPFRNNRLGQGGFMSIPSQTLPIFGGVPGTQLTVYEDDGAQGRDKRPGFDHTRIDPTGATHPLRT
jgi:hypothetical protein